jgi:hypothetical protein
MTVVDPGDPEVPEMGLFSFSPARVLNPGKSRESRGRFLYHAKASRQRAAVFFVVKVFI